MPAVCLETVGQEQHKTELYENTWLHHSTASRQQLTDDWGEPSSSVKAEMGRGSPICCDGQWRRRVSYSLRTTFINALWQDYDRSPRKQPIISPKGKENPEKSPDCDPHSVRRHWIKKPRSERRSYESYVNNIQKKCPQISFLHFFQSKEENNYSDRHQ